MMTRLPMFPLGSVLLPSVYLPLHVFEPRYRQLVVDCLQGDQEFGVVLIERGSEVGGGETRTSVGSVARIIEAAQTDDGRWALGAVGTRRIRVVDWLPDQPYPMAEVDDWPELDPPTDLADRLAEAVRLLRRCLAGRAELGESAVAATIELSDDPVLASYQAVAVSPFGPADQQRLLEVATASERVDRLAELLTEEATFLAQRLALESGTAFPEDDADG